MCEHKVRHDSFSVDRHALIDKNIGLGGYCAYERPNNQPGYPKPWSNSGILPSGLKIPRERKWLISVTAERDSTISPQKIFCAQWSCERCKHPKDQ